MSECSSLLNVASILEGLVREPMQEASTSMRSSSSWVLTIPFRAMISFIYVSANRSSRYLALCSSDLMAHASGMPPYVTYSAQP